MEVKNSLEDIDERTLHSRYGEATVRYGNEVVMENGVLKDTPLAREWWGKKRKRKPSSSSGQE